VRYRFALQTVVAKEAKAYGFTIVVWSTGAFLMIERGKPTAGAILAFVGGLLLAQGTAVFVAYVSPARIWNDPSMREYVWSTFHAGPIAVGVLLAWLLASQLSGMWAYFVASLVAALAYQLLLGLEAMLLSAEDSDSRSDSSF
jgi:hypothetical protein